MLRTASIEHAAQLGKVKEGFGEAEVRARFDWISSVHVTWYVWWIADAPRAWALIQWDGKATAPAYPDFFDLYVHRDMRSQGIGAQLLRACEQIVRDAGYGKLGLAVNPDLNRRAYEFYQRLGYYAISQEKYLDGVYGGVEDWVIDLEKRL